MTVNEAYEIYAMSRPCGLGPVVCRDRLRRLDALLADELALFGLALDVPDDYGDDAELPVPFPYDEIYPAYLSVCDDALRGDAELLALSRGAFERVKEKYYEVRRGELL